MVGSRADGGCRWVQSDQKDSTWGARAVSYGSARGRGGGKSQRVARTEWKAEIFLMPSS